MIIFSFRVYIILFLCSLCWKYYKKTVPVTMNLNNSSNQGYWFVLREDQSNVIFSSNNFTIQNPPIAGQETRYIVDTGDRQFIQINDVPVVTEELITDQEETEIKQKDECNFWDRNKIKLLLTLCLENNFKNTTKDGGVLEDMAALLGSTADECSNKYKNLRRTFIRLLKKKRQGKHIKWVHYDICEKVFNDCKSLPSSVLEPWDDYKVRILLNSYLENINRFKSSECLQKDIWKDIASRVGTSEYNCYHKFKNLKRAYHNWLQRSRNTGKPLKWPYHHYFERIFYEYNPNIGAWDRTKTRHLMDAYLQMADKFKDPTYQKKDLWKEIAMIVNESAHNCDKKFRNLKQTYLKLKLRANTGRSITKWRYYKDFEEIYGPCWGSSNIQGEGYVRQLLQFYIDNKDKFKDPRNKKKQVWRLLAPKVGLSSEGCDRKFRNLKQTYIRLTEKKKLTGKTIRWPYFSYFEEIFDNPLVSPHNSAYINTVDETTMTDIKQAVKQLQHTKDDDKFERLVTELEESNNIQRERNRILQALLDRQC